MAASTSSLPWNSTDPITSLYLAYDDILSKGDPRVASLPLMSSPLPTIAICLSFVLVVKVLGPALMRNRQPYQLSRTLVVYNAIQVLISTYLFYESAMSGWLTGYSYRCQPVDYSRSPEAMRTLTSCYLYYLSKFTEFFDTIFFVLRKKTSHVSLLHVVHHGIMPFSVWFGVKFGPGGHGTLFGFLNTFVHIWMYLYYMLAAMGPKYQKYITWKKHLTKMQIIQFVLIMVHALQLLFIECNYSRWYVYWIIGHALMFLGLFGDFYVRSYHKGRRDAQRAIRSKGNAWELGKIVPCNLPSVCQTTTASEESNSHLKSDGRSTSTEESFEHSMERTRETIEDFDETDSGISSGSPGSTHENSPVPGATRKRMTIKGRE